jgi:hypothetical protein
MKSILKFTSFPRQLAWLLLALLLATSARAGEPLIITNGFEIELVSVVDEKGERPSAEAQMLRLTFRRPTANGAARLRIISDLFPRREGDPEDFPDVEALFIDGATSTVLELSLAATNAPGSEAERLAALALTPGSRNRRALANFYWGMAVDGELNGFSQIELDDLRAPPTLDYPGTFGSEDPHEAAEVGMPYERRAETALAEFRRLAALPPEFAPWTNHFEFSPSFLLAQADGLIVAQDSGSNAVRYRRDGSRDATFLPPMVEVDVGPIGEVRLSAVDILGQLPDGRFLGRTGHADFGRPRRSGGRLVAFNGTNVTEGEVLAKLTPSSPGYSIWGPYSLPQFAVVNADGSMILDQGVRRRGCHEASGSGLENTKVIGLPSVNGERLRRTRAKLFWKPPTATQFAFRQSRRSRAVREGAGNLTLEVRRLGDLSGTRRVTVRTEQGTAHAGQDYQAINTVLEFQPGRISRSLTIPILNDELREGAETFSALLSPAPDDPGTSLAMIATPRHTITIQEDVRLEWSAPNRVRVWNPPYQFNARAFSSLIELQTAPPLEIGRFRFPSEAAHCLGLGTTQYAPATDYFDLDLTTLPIRGQFPDNQQPWATLEEIRSAAGARAVFLRVDGVDEDDEETNDYCP